MACLAALALQGCAPGTAQGAAAAVGIEVVLREARPVVAESLSEGERRIGRLRLLAAYTLASPTTPGFGGLSAVRLAGRHLLLLSDRGRLFRAERLEDEAGRLLGLRGWTELRLPKGWRDADTEALAALPDGTLVIAAEDRDELLRLDPDGRPAGRVPLPDFLRRPPLNQGLETLTDLPGGGLLAVTEGLAVGPDLVAAARLDGPRATRLAARAPDGFRPTDAAVAGRTLFLLGRRLTLLGGLEARLVAAPLDHALTAGALDGEELARLGAGSFGENFEGVAARETAPGRFLLYLVADDNFSPLQRTLLLQLAWEEPGASGRGRRADLRPRPPPPASP